MENQNPSSPSLSRGKIFAVGSVVTIIMCGLVLTCIPEKPAVIADAAKPQAVPTGEANPQEAGASVAAREVAAAPTPVGPSDLKGGSTGERVYARYCAGCHGADGKAQTTMARMMSSRPTNLAEGPWKGPQTKEAIIEIVKAGKGAMPAYSKEISSEAELESLAQHVLTLSSGSKK